MKNPLSKLDFQLAYLALLTKQQVKPLSRWEKGIPINSRDSNILKRYGLKVENVERKLLNGKYTFETIFGTKSRYLDSYLKSFENKPIATKKSDRVKQGFLFGYPYCCVKNFVENGYTKNPYIGREQKLLFHWICPDCRNTPSLIPYYQKIHNECEYIFTEASSTHLNNPITGLCRKSLPIATSFLIALGVPLIVNSQLHADEHWLTVQDDIDNDFLSYREEVLLGTQCFHLYPTSADSIAKSYKTIIDYLPREESDTTCYACDNYTYGHYTCPICGETANMGYVDVYNPLRNFVIQVPYMAMHFMEHGSFSYIIEGDSSRVDIELLKEVLAPFDTQHLVIETASDIDNDGLNNASEEHFDMNPDNPHTHNIGIDDGQEITEAIIEHISDLPEASGGTTPTDQIYIQYHLVYGVEQCEICGETVNMGLTTIVDPIQGTSIEFPIISLHYMAHGRFAYSGTTNFGEIDPIELCTVLDIDLTGIENLPEIAEKYGYQLINFPNPFNASTTISFSATDLHKLKGIKIYNVRGQLLKTLSPMISDQSPMTKVEWNGTDKNDKPVPSGIYLCKLEVDGKTVATRKCLLIR
ncbi:T9SS type A sorting domain-containing protein [candidate division WOR-3 bacterium]|nr:T9SS type A sorting domain-containing protein [candidate division WOR-3 bacterium]